MIEVSLEARSRFFGLLQDLRLPDGLSLRLERIGNGSGPGPGLVMRVAYPQAGDEAVEHGGEVLFYVSIAVSAAYDGCLMDLVETPEGACFGLGPPAVWQP